MIELNRRGWYAVHESWDALQMIAPTRDQMLGDPLAGFRAVMERRPTSDKAVMDDPDWQRVMIEAVTEALAEAPKVGRMKPWR